MRYGGSSNIENLQLLCVRCHRSKSTQERSKKRIMISCDEIDEKSIYITTLDIPKQYVSGKIKTSDMLVMGEGMFILTTNQGTRHIPRPMRVQKTGVKRGKYQNFIDVFCGPMDQESSQEYTHLFDRKADGDMSHDILQRMEKYQIQRLYNNKIDSDFVNGFKWKKRAIFNRSFMNYFPCVKVREEIDIHMNIMNNEYGLDGFRLDAMQIFELIKTLAIIGFGKVGDVNTKISLHTLPADKLNSLKQCVDFIQKCDMGRSKTDCPVKRFKFHVTNVLGYGFKRHRVDRRGKKYTVYSLIDTIEDIFLDNNIFRDQWIDNHKYRVEKFSREKGEDMKLVYVNEFIQARDLKRKIEENKKQVAERVTKRPVMEDYFEFTSVPKKRRMN